MKTNTLIKNSIILFGFAAAILFSSCYTVLKQSGEYYSEFGQNTSDKSKDTAEEAVPEEDSSAVDEQTDQSDNYGTEVINRYYYDSPWWGGYGYGYPGRNWAVSIGYTGYPTYWYSPYDYYYWGGCYYPSYPGYYVYYPDPWYYPGTSYPAYSSRRNYGLRRDALNSSGVHFSGVSTVGSQREYNSGTTAGSKSTSATKNKKAVTETKKNRRRFNTKSVNADSRPVEKKETSKGGKSGRREYKNADVPKNNNRSFQQGFENAKNHFTRNDNQSSRSYNNNSSGGGSSNRSSGARSSSPNVNRTYKSKK